jgi:hypothetical protein
VGFTGDDDAMPTGGFTRSRFDLQSGRVVRDDETSFVSADQRSAAADEAAEARARDEAMLALYAGMLRDALVAALPGWIQRCVRTRVEDARGAGVAAIDDAAVERAANLAGEQAAIDIGPRLTRLLTADIDQQDTTPLELLRQATVHATAALRALGVPAIQRDDQDVALHPDDDYGLAPAALGDVDEALGEVGIRWGAAKAHVHLTRRSGDGPTH